VVEYILPDAPESYRQNWKLPMSAIRLIGEYTNSDGPYLDDYFFVFVLADGTWRQASFYAEGRDGFLSALGKPSAHNSNVACVAPRNSKAESSGPKHCAGKPCSPSRVCRNLEILPQTVAKAESDFPV